MEDQLDLTEIHKTASMRRVLCSLYLYRFTMGLIFASNVAR